MSKKKQLHLSSPFQDVKHVLLEPNSGLNRGHSITYLF